MTRRSVSLQTSTDSESSPPASASGSFDPLAGPRRFKSRESPRRRRRRRNHSSPPLPLHHRSHRKHRAAARPHHRTQASRRYAHTHTHLRCSAELLLPARPGQARLSVSRGPGAGSPPAGPAACSDECSMPATEWCQCASAIGPATVTIRRIVRSLRLLGGSFDPLAGPRRHPAV